MNTENTNDQTTFASFDLPKPLHDALETMRYRTPTPIQSRGIPVVMEGKDLIGIAQTGTGKTAAFMIPMVKALFENKEAQGVVLVPTRELATQIYEISRQLTQNIKSLKPWVLVGGTSMFAQVKSLPRKPRLIIATPGRLMDHLEKRTFNLSDVKMVVLDEADRMLDIGFEPQIRKIFNYLPKERQTLLFSATFPKTIDRLTRDYMSHPAKITVGKVSEPAKEIDQSFVHTTVPGKNQLLIQELNERTGSVLIFVRTKHKVDRISKFIDQNGFEVDRIHGARTQGQRNRVINDFRSMKIRILVATDVASRGLDIPHIEHVINYDIPEVPEDYVHRIGRTARAGAKGHSISFITAEDKTKWMYLSRHLNALGVKTNVKAVAIKETTSVVMPKAKTEKPLSEMTPLERAEKADQVQIEYKRKTFDKVFNASRGDRPRFGGNKRFGRGEQRNRSEGERSDRKPRFGNRFQRDDSRAPRGEGRSFSRGPRSEGRSFESRAPRREGRGFQKREGGNFQRNDRAPRGEGRSFSRGPRSEGRSFESRGPRSESRSFQPRDGQRSGGFNRKFKRPSRPNPRPDTRS